MIVLKYSSVHIVKYGTDILVFLDQFDYKGKLNWYFTHWKRFVLSTDISAAQVKRFRTYKKEMILNAIIKI